MQATKVSEAIALQLETNTLIQGGILNSQQQMDLTNEIIYIMQITMRLQCNPTLPYVCETMVTLDNVTKWRQELSMYLRGHWNS